VNKHSGSAFNSFPPAPMLSRQAASGSLGPRTRRAEPREAPSLGPEALVEKVLALLRDDLHLPARRLAAEALARYPDHKRVQWSWKIFENRARSRAGSGNPEPLGDEEYEKLSRWLRDPPESARGKWVALVDGEVVACAETLAEVNGVLRTRAFPKRPLVHQVE
jgi:hypothetical protein